MSLTLGREGGIAKPLKKRTVGQINIAHVYDGSNHIWPTSVIHFSDFTSVQLRYIWGSDDGRDLDTKSYYVNSPINSLNYIAVGWSWNLSQIPYLYWVVIIEECLFFLWLMELLICLMDMVAIKNVGMVKLLKELLNLIMKLSKF